MVVPLLIAAAKASSSSVSISPASFRKALKLDSDTDERLLDQRTSALQTAPDPLQELGDSPRFDAFCLVWVQISTCHLEVVVALQVQPELRTIAEIQGLSECGVGRDAPSIVEISTIRFGEIPMAFASRFCDSPNSAKNSSLSISPGVIGANAFSAIILSC
jgi:hypothetical protein